MARLSGRARDEEPPHPARNQRPTDSPVPSRTLLHKPRTSYGPGPHRATARKKPQLTAARTPPAQSTRRLNSQLGWEPATSRRPARQLSRSLKEPPLSTTETPACSSLTNAFHPRPAVARALPAVRPSAARVTLPEATPPTAAIPSLLSRAGRRSGVGCKRQLGYCQTQPSPSRPLMPPTAPNDQGPRRLQLHRPISAPTLLLLPMTVKLQRAARD